MRRSHRMPFGAQLDERAGTRFRLWAPAARRVDVMLGDPGNALALSMPSMGDGWFEATAEAQDATRYAFRIDGDRRVPDPASRFNPDGVHEAMNKREEEFGDHGLARVVAQLAETGTAQQIADSILDASSLHASANGGPADDRTVVVLKVRPGERLTQVDPMY